MPLSCVSVGAVILQCCAPKLKRSYHNTANVTQVVFCCCCQYDCYICIKPKVGKTECLSSHRHVKRDTGMNLIWSDKR